MKKISSLRALSEAIHLGHAPRKMDCRVAALLAMTVVFSASSANAENAMDLAANLGSQLGKATHCGFETDEFLKLSGKAIDAKTRYGKPERGKAIEQFVIAATMSSKSGPIVESCKEFKQGYEESLNVLRERFQ